MATFEHGEVIVTDVVNNKCCFFAGVNRLPNDSLKVFREEFSLKYANLSNMCCKYNVKLVLGGDFNTDLLSWICLCSRLY